MIQKLMHDPMAWKLVVATAICILLFMLAVLVLRRIRHSISSEAELGRTSPNNEAALTLAAYGGGGPKARRTEKKEQRGPRNREGQGGRDRQKPRSGNLPPQTRGGVF